MSKYYILVGIHKENEKDNQFFECIFSDYDKETVIYEKDSEYLNFKKMKIITLNSASQSVIDAKIDQLNGVNSKENFNTVSTEKEIEQLEKALKSKKAKLKKLLPVEEVETVELEDNQIIESGYIAIDIDVKRDNQIIESYTLSLGIEHNKHVQNIIELLPLYISGKLHTIEQMKVVQTFLLCSKTPTEHAVNTLFFR